MVIFLRSFCLQGLFASLFFFLSNPAEARGGYTSGSADLDQMRNK